MSAAMTGRVDPAIWLGLPALASLLASLVLAAPLRLFGLALPEPVFAMAPAFAWAVLRPSILPPFVLVALGLALGALWGGPPGLWAVVLLSVYAPVFIAREFLAGQAFVVLWAWYTAACAAGFAVGWMLCAARTGVEPNLVAVFWQFLVSAALFPFAWRLIERFEDADVRFR